MAIAGVRRRQGDVDGAIAAYDEAIARDPRNPRWPLERGHALMMARRYNEAVAAYARSLAADPAHHSATLHQAIALLMAGELDRADAVFASLPPQPGENRYRHGVAFTLAWLRRDGTAALTALATATDWVTTPALPTARTPTPYLRGLALALQGNAAGASAAFAEARRLIASRRGEGGDDRNLLVMEALVRAHAGELAQALSIARGIAERLPLDRDAVTAPPFHAALAEVAALAGDDDLATAILRDLLERPSGHVLSDAVLSRDPRFDAVRASLAP